MRTSASRRVRPRLTGGFFTRVGAIAGTLALAAVSFRQGEVWGVIPLVLTPVFTWPLLRDALLLRWGAAVPARVVEKDRQAVFRRIVYEFRELPAESSARIRVPVTVSGAAFVRTNVGDVLTTYHSRWEPRICTVDRFARFRVVER
jgi:hypothetical protein